MNLHAFRWGRLYVQDRAAVERELRRGGSGAGLTTPDDPARAALSELEARMPEARATVDELLALGGFEGEVRRLAEIRIPELVLYQNAAYARRYVEFVRRVVEAEQKRTPGRTGLGEAIARYLFKLMAYKDEYEVARLLLKESVLQDVRAEFGEEVRLAFNLHPPILRALGLKRKIRLGPRFMPFLKLLRALCGLRGTPLDLFGYARVRRVERQLIEEYRSLIGSLLPELSEETYDLAVQIAELADLVRGYEGIKLASVQQFRERAQALRQQLLAREPAVFAI
jgi:indolepyruvate ferredoxin oxidoreductase